MSLIALLFLGAVAGFGLPLQTSINARLKKKVFSPFRVSLISFSVSLLSLLIALIATKQDISIPFELVSKKEPWIWLGGICGVVFLLGNILLLSRLGSIKTVVLPALGQILMGLLIDNFSWFHSAYSQLTATRAFGAMLVFCGVLIISIAKNSKLPAIHPSAKLTDGRGAVSQLLWSVFGVVTGMVSACQTAINGYLGLAIDSSIKASFISMAVGILLLVLIVVVESPHMSEKSSSERGIRPWWMWTGGFFGALYVLTNVVLSHVLGTGMTVIVVLIGSMIGGLLIDHFGWLETPIRRLNTKKVAGVLTMLVGAAIVRMF